MIHLQLSYFLSVVALSLLGISFFCYDFYAPYIKRWKANQLLLQSQVYLDEKIGSSPELISVGIRKAKVAYLLDTKNSKSYQNYLNLLYLDSPSKALMEWSHLVDGSAEGISLGNTILRKSLKCLRDQSLDLKTKILIT